MNSFTNLEKNTDRNTRHLYRLDRMKAFLKFLGNPETKFKTVHIAGSKGKGSTCAFIASIISASKGKTGLYLSPHVSNYKERFTLCGEFIDEKILINTADYLKEQINSFSPVYFSDKNSENENFTTFELYTVFAFLLFYRLKCKYAVIETGLGGRLDATNVLDSSLCVFTPIELEHTEFLGNSISEIAGEKSKIIKKNSIVFTSLQQKESLDIIKKEAKNCGCDIYCLKDYLKTISCKFKNNSENIRIKFKDGFSTKLKLKMIGKAQAYNCALALLVALKTNLYKKNETERALEKTFLPGRLEKIENKRIFYLDGAHTPLSMKLLLESWKQMNKKKPGICIFGCVEGKKAEQMQEQIFKFFNKIVVSKPGTFKKNNPSLIYENFIKMLEKSKNNSDKKIVLIEEAENAVRWAVENSDINEQILVCGSFYLAGEFTKVLKKTEDNKKAEI